jgi:hypothetical protein
MDETLAGRYNSVTSGRYDRSTFTLGGRRPDRARLANDLALLRVKGKRSGLSTTAARPNTGLSVHCHHAGKARCFTEASWSILRS